MTSPRLPSVPARDQRGAEVARPQVEGFFHVGLNVVDIDRSLRFYRDLLGFELMWERVYTEPYIFDILGATAQAVRAAYLRIPGSEVVFELLEYRPAQPPAGVAGANPLCNGRAHTCLYVKSGPEIFAALVAAGFEPRSRAPVPITAGPNAGALNFYVDDPDGHALELFQKPG